MCDQLKKVLGGPTCDCCKDRYRQDPAEFDRVIEQAKSLFQEKTMHYRNGREAKNGDRIAQIQISGGKITAVGVLYDATPGNDYCNGSIAPIQQSVTGACMCDCIHMEDLEALIKEKGWDKRPAGK